MNLGRQWHTLMVSVRSMSELVAQVKDEEMYMSTRERVHRNTAESTNSRVKWWSIFQLIVLAAQGFFQVWWLKRFFEVSKMMKWITGLLGHHTNVLSRSSALYKRCLLGNFELVRGRIYHLS